MRPDLSLENGSDSLLTQVKSNKGKYLVVGVIYKPRDTDVAIFINSLKLN